MNGIIKNYLSAIHIQEIEYSKCNALKENWLEKNIALYIPSWDFLNQKKYEILVKSFGGLIYGKGNKVTADFNSQKIEFENDNPFHLLKQIEKEWAEDNRLPFSFYTGILSYDLYTKIEALGLNRDFYKLPDYYLLFPAEALLINHTDQKMYLLNSAEKIVSPDKCSSRFNSNHTQKIVINERRETYLKKIQQIRDLIFNGEVYQLNYTIRFSAPFEENGFTFFNDLYKINPAPFSFYARLPHCELISNSPERFLSVNSDCVLTEPIKGTIKRVKDKTADEALKKELLSSLKDESELSMIVDLLRNDLSKVCRASTVKVISHKRLETFTNVHHLVSSISGQLKSDKNFIDLLEAAFPGGSITGCPKIAAIKFIKDLEIHNRSFYTGTFFIRFPQLDQFDSNILIRTAVKKDDAIHFQAGGAIVIDSEPEKEFEECMAKANSFLKTAEKYNVRLF